MRTKRQAIVLNIDYLCHLLHHPNTWNIRERLVNCLSRHASIALGPALSHSNRIFSLGQILRVLPRFGRCFIRRLAFRCKCLLLTSFQVEKAVDAAVLSCPVGFDYSWFCSLQDPDSWCCCRLGEDSADYSWRGLATQTPTNSTLKSEHPCPKRLHLPANRRWAASNESFVPESLGGGVSSIEFIRALIIQCHSVQLQYVCSPPIYCSRVFPEVQISDVNEQQHTSNSGRRYCFY